MACEAGKKRGIEMDIFVDRASSPFEKKEEASRFRRRKKERAERRRMRQDRRQSVQEGLVVSLSVEGERRNGRDRRGGEPGPRPEQAPLEHPIPAMMAGVLSVVV